ncbi:MAG: transposon-encoded TnpW family protein [Oscillospiraceae bacterium]|nr:transposon-encoded TnpW family protein [Oscillospiraceae bacterium]
MKTAAEKCAVTMPKEAEPVKLLKRIGSTLYKVSIYFSENSKETLEDKILRLIEREVHDNV